MTKKLKVTVILIFVGIILTSMFHVISNIRKEAFLNEINGTIYYLKRDQEILKLYKSDANLKNEKLIYSHYKKGKIDDENNNDNISDFRFYPEDGLIEFEAMYNGEWSIFTIKKDEKKPQYVKRAPEDYKTLEDYRVVGLDVDYINLESKKFKIFEKNGSLYREENGNTECIKKFRGVIKSDIPGIAGYYPEGLSPDSKYLIYGTTNSLTGIGYFLGLNKYKRYIMDLDTLKSVEYLNVYDIQWVIDN